jgi:hypothetical protein
MRAILTPLAGRWFAQRQHGCNRREEIAPVEAG